MLHHARVVVAEKRYRTSTAICKKCGQPVAYTTRPASYCPTCIPKRDHRKQDYNRRYATMRRAEAKEAARAILNAPVEAREGFCACCGVIRLSKADTGGVCWECRQDK